MRYRHPNKQRAVDPKQIWVSPGGNRFTVIVNVNADRISATWTAYEFNHKKIASGPMKVTMSQSEAKDLNEKIKKYVDVILGIEQVNHNFSEANNGT